MLPDFRPDQVTIAPTATYGSSTSVVTSSGTTLLDAGCVDCSRYDFAAGQHPTDLPVDLASYAPFLCGTFAQSGALKR